MAKHLKSESGYSLVEVMVAIMLLGLAIIPMVGMFDAGLRAAVLGSNYDTARVTAIEELEEIKALPYDASGDGINNNSVVELYPPDSSPHTCSAPIPAVLDSCQVDTAYARLDSSDVVLDPNARTMMQVDVTVTWDGGGNSYNATGLISEETP